MKNTKSYKRILKETSAQLKRELHEALERADTMFAKHADILDRILRERDEARDTISDVMNALDAIEHEGPRLAALRVKGERDEAREQLDVWKHEDELTRAEYKKAYDASEDNITTFRDLRERLAAERALADRLAGALTNPAIHVAMEALDAWKEARNE